MRAMRYGLIAVGVLLVVIAVLVTVVLSTDLGRFKPLAESLASDLLARPLRIEGPLHVTVGEEIHVVAEAILIENPDWASEQALVRVQKLDIALNTMDLLRGRYLIENIELNDIAVHLEQDEAGANTWTLFGSDSDAATDDDESGAPLDLMIRQARIRNLSVTYDDPGRESPLVFSAAALDQVELESGDLQLTLDADIDGTPVTLAGTAGTFADLIAAGPAHMDLRATIGEIGINGAGQIDSLADPRSADGKLEISGPNAQYLTDVIGIAPVTSGPLNLVATIGPVDDRIDLKIQGNFGEFKIDVTGSVSDLQDFDDANIDFSAKGPDASTFGELSGLQNIPPDPYAVAGRLRRAGDSVTIEDVAVEIGKTKFDFSATIANLSGIDGSVANLTLGGPDFSRFNKLIGLPGKLTGPFTLTAELRQSPEGDELMDVVATARDIRARIKGKVSAEPDFVGTELTVEIEGGDLAVVTAAFDIANGPRAPFDVSAALSRTERGITVTDGIARLDKDVIRVDGLVGNQPLERDTDLRFKVAGPDLARTINMAGVELDTVPPGSYEAAGRIRPGTEYFDLDDITARLGDTRAKLSGRLGALADFDGTDIDVRIEADSLAGLAPETGNFSLADVPFSVTTNIRIADEVLNVRELAVQAGDGQLKGAASIGMAPLLASGSADINAFGPNISEWLPSSSDYLPADAPFDLDVGVRWQDTLVTVDRLNLQLAKGRVTIDGKADLFKDLARTDLTLDAQVASLSNLGQIAGRPLPDEPLTLSAQLVGSAQAIRLQDLRLTTGKSDLSGSAAYDIQGDTPRVDLKLTSGYMNLSPFIAKEDDTARDDGAAESAPQADDSRLIPDTPIPMDLLNQLDSRVDISFAELVLGENTFKDILVDGSLQDGALRIDKFEVAGHRGGVLGGQLELLPAPQGAAISASIDGTNLTVGLTPSSPDAVDKLPSYDVQVKLAGRGATIREVAATLDGTVRLIGGSGQIKGIPGWFMGDIAEEVADKVNPFTKKEGYTTIQCSTILLRSVDGKIDGVPAVVLQTDKLNIISVAYADLDTEKIDVKFETNARKGIGIGMADFVTPYTKITGTMANPKLAFDSEEAAKRGAQTAATLGTSWVAKKVKNRFFSAKDPCGAEVAKADEEMRQIETRQSGLL